MYKPSDEFLNYISSSIIRKPLSKVVIDGVEHRELKSYPKIEHSADSFFGVFPIKECTFEIYDLEGTLSLKGKEIKVYRGLTLPSGDEWIPMGIFTSEADGISVNSSAKTVKFKGYDRARKFDIEFNGENQAYPCTVFDFVKKICSNHLVELESDSFPFGDITLSAQPEIADGTTERELISNIAALGGCIAQITREGKLRISPPTKTDLTFSGSRYKTFSKKTPVKVSQVKIKAEDTDFSFSAQTSGEEITRLYEIENNPFTFGREEELIAQIGENITALTCTPFEMTEAIDDFIFDLSDIFTVKSKENETEVTVLSIASTGRIKSTLKAEVASETTSAVQGSLKQQLKAQKEETELFKKSQQALNELMSGALGLYQTALEGDTGGSVIYYHNEPTLAESTYIITLNASGFAHTTGSGCWNGGEPDWKYGIDKDGNAVLNTLALHGLIADWIKAGTISSKDSTTYFDLDNGKISTSFTGTENDVQTTLSTLLTSGIAKLSKTVGEDTVSSTIIGNAGMLMDTVVPEEYVFTKPDNWDSMSYFAQLKYMANDISKYLLNSYYGINIATTDEDENVHIAHLDGRKLSFTDGKLNEKNAFNVLSEYRSDGANIGGDVDVSGNVEVGGGIMLNAGFETDGDAVIGGDAEINGSLTVGGRTYAQNKVLWNDVRYMSAGHTITLSEKVSAQPNGIVLVFSRYKNGEVINSTFSTHFISKYQVSAFPSGGGYTFFLVNNADVTVVGVKHLYITDTQIKGDDSNVTELQENCGINHNNKGFVLRYVIGV